MQKVLTAAEMREVDRLTTERYGIPSIILMENAAHAVARVIAEKLGGSVKGKRILILCGKGNNGGDGAALARILWQHGACCMVLIVGKISESKGDARTNFEMVQQLAKSQTGYFNTSRNWIGIKVVDDVDEISEYFYVSRIDVSVDALFGTGFTGRLDGMHKDVVELYLNRGRSLTRAPILVSIDLPSGVNADSNLLGSDLPDELIEEQNRVSGVANSDVTVTFTAPKLANVLPPASRCSKELIIAPIGTPSKIVEEITSQLFLSTWEDAERFLRLTWFANSTYKNKRGHALIVAGSENYSGAAVLCGNSAIRSGVGLVTVATPRSSKDSIAGRVVPEVMVRPVSETDSGAVSAEAIEDVEAFLKNVDAVAIGAGLSASDESTGQFLRHFFENRKMPTILDADALTLLSPFSSLPSVAKDAPPLILTPHEGEFMRMLGTEDKKVIKDRVSAVREFSQKHNVILVLKGERVLIGEPGGKVVVNPTGNSGLGKAGNGDTLLGILTGFVAQAAKMEIDIFETVVAAVYVAGMAGDIAEKKYGKRVMTASDVRECLAEVFAGFEKG